MVKKLMLFIFLCTNNLVNASDDSSYEKKVFDSNIEDIKNNNYGELWRIQNPEALYQGLPLAEFARKEGKNDIADFIDLLARQKKLSAPGGAGQLSIDERIKLAINDYGYAELKSLVPSQVLSTQELVSWAEKFINPNRTDLKNKIVDYLKTQLAITQAVRAIESADFPKIESLFNNPNQRFPISSVDRSGNGRTLISIARFYQKNNPADEARKKILDYLQEKLETDAAKINDRKW